MANYRFLVAAASAGCYALRLAQAGGAGGMGCGPGVGNWSDGLDVGGYPWVAAILIISAYYALNHPARA